VSGDLCDCGDSTGHHDRAGCANPTCSCRKPGPGGASEWTLEIDQLGRPILSNAAHKMHWQQAGKLRREWRDVAATLARAWRIGAQEAIGLTVWPRYPTRMVPDVDAPSPSVKGVLDGLVLAGVIPDDKPPYVASVLYLPAVVAPGEPPALIVRVAVAS
jgi:hypothetical protein